MPAVNAVLSGETHLEVGATQQSVSTGSTVDTRTLWIGHQKASSSCQQHFQRRVNNIELEMRAHEHFAHTDVFPKISIYTLLATASLSTGPYGVISSTINPVGPSGDTYGKHDVKDFTLNVSKTGIEFRQRHLRLLVGEQLRHCSAFPALILISRDCYISEVFSLFGSSGFGRPFPGTMFLK